VHAFRHPGLAVSFEVGLDGRPARFCKPPIISVNCRWLHASGTISMMRQSSAAADIGHLRRHHGHELDIRFERQAGHIGDPTRDIVHIDARFRLDLAAGLQTTSCRVFVARSRGIADVDLAAGDVVFAPIE
jgi:hypothetical protein